MSFCLGYGCSHDDIFSSKHYYDIPFNIQIDQPDLGLPLAMYSDEESYATYIKAYKQYMVDVATILVNTVESLKLSTTTAFATAGRH